jgi:hypothetical protein
MEGPAAVCCPLIVRSARNPEVVSRNINVAQLTANLTLGVGTDDFLSGESWSMVFMEEDVNG